MSRQAPAGEGGRGWVPRPGFHESQAQGEWASVWGSQGSLFGGRGDIVQGNHGDSGGSPRLLGETAT